MLTGLPQKFRIWLFRPHIADGPVTLTQRRIFIVPTRQGMAFAVVLLLMLMGDINYNLSLGYVLTFLLATIALMTMLYAFRNMAQLEVSAGPVTAVHAGEQARFTFTLHNGGPLPRYQLQLQAGSATTAGRASEISVDIPARQSLQVQLPVATLRRGWLRSGRVTLYTRFPLGLFYAWSYLQFDTRCLVYPKAAATQPLPASSAQDGSGTLGNIGDEDFSGLRNYVPGDPLPRIAWKAMAKEHGLQVKQFSAAQGHELWLDWDAIAAPDTETRLAVLTHWVLEADVRQLRYGLRLPGVELPPNSHAGHRNECLRTLALFGLPAES
ncbi:MAG: DUF58 domain-containing protein [Pseudomonadota bacterium]